MFRTLLVAVLSVLALSSVAVGTAQAAPVLAADSSACTEARNTLATAKAELEVVKLETPVVPAKVTAAEAKVSTAQSTVNSVCSVVTPPTTTPPSGTYDTCREYNDHGVYSILRGDPRYKSRLDRDGDGVACELNEGSGNGNGGHYRDCNDARSHNARDFRRGDLNWNDSWDRNRNGVACDSGDVVIVDGDCTTYIRESRDYGTRYNSLAQERYNNARRSSSDGGTNITDAERDAIRNASDLRSYRDRYNSSSSELRRVCNKNPDVVIVDNSNPVTMTTQAPPAVGNGNPMPLGSSGGQVSRSPSGGAETGDGSTVLSS